MNHSPLHTRPVLLVFALAGYFPSLGLPRTNAQQVREMSIRRTQENVPFGLIGKVGKAPAPTLIVFTHGLDVMRREPVYTEVAEMMSRRGWISVVIEPPCHGEDTRAGEPPQLAGWRYRLERDVSFMPTFIAKARSILDFLIKERVADPERLAIYGVSRGGFLAFHFAAAEPRLKAVAAISPVAKLLVLREFADTSRKDKFESLDIARLAPKLAGRAVWLSIGNNDARVNTDDSIAFTRAVVRASARPDKPDEIIPVELLVGPTAGHSKIDRAHELLAEWLVSRFPPPKAN